jgi:hypothetical protein
MADVLGDILKGAGNVAEGIYTGLRDWGRNYKYGPYYEQNQNLAVQRILADMKSEEARLESEKARKAYWERPERTQTLTLKDLNDTIRALDEQTFLLEPNKSDKPDVAAQKADTQKQLGQIRNQVYNYMQNMLGTSTPRPSPGQAFAPTPSPAPTPMATSASSANINKGQGALSNIAPDEFIGPPIPSGFVNPNWFESKSFQPSSFTKGKGIKTTNEIDFYMSKLDKESQGELQQIINTGNQALINRAIQRLRDKYGNIR